MGEQAIKVRGTTYRWCEATLDDTYINVYRVGLDAACAYAEGDGRDAEISRVLAASRGRYLHFKAMDDRWATGCRHAVLSNADQILPGVRS